MATIRDVAKASGVSIATVSHVLNGRNSKVSDETRERVLAAVRELRYRPTPLEHKQKAILTNNIGFFASDLSSSPITRNQYFGLILNAVLEAAAFRSYSTTIFVERMWDDIGHAVRRNYDGRCDGVLMLAPAQSEVVKLLWERGTPMVSIGSTSSLPGVSSIDIDNALASSELVDYLFALGHRKIAYFGGNVMTMSALERCRGFLDAMNRHSAAAEDASAVFTRITSPEWEFYPSVGMSLGRHVWNVDRVCEFELDNPSAATQLLSTVMPDATAVICYNDQTARELIDSAAKLGLRVPVDLSVVSFDDSKDAGEPYPGLTSMRQPYHQIGKTAVEVLLARINDHQQPSQSVRFNTELVIRDSAAPPRR